MAKKEKKEKRPDIIELAESIGQLVKKKNTAYGNSFERVGEILAIMYPDGIEPENYVDMAAVVRILDKLLRIANDKRAFQESPFLDIVGYGLLGAALNDG